MRSKVKISVLIKYIVLCSVALIMLYPLFWVFLSSLKENNKIFSRPFSFPLKPKWDNYSTAWEAADVPLHMLNTVIYAVCSVAGVTIASAMTSYVIARIEKGRKIYHYYSLGIMIPINAIIIPFILIFRKIGILNTRIGIILAFIVTNLAFSIFILTPFMESIPKELEEAAKIDGCNRVQIFWKIILPISKSGLATVATFVLIKDRKSVV